ncbi:MAG: M42 family metallopeptidase [Ruminococcaceae bacterium]|nr:M42 family metallopeptidase [Oscillospiraceae bacterium]
MERILEFARDLCLIDGISSREDDVRDYIINKIKNENTCSFIVDNLGNLIVEKKGKKKPQNKIMIDAHTDEVGLIVSYITSDGFLKIHNVGSINAKVLLGRTVKVNGLTGVVGIKPVHLVSKDKSKDIPEKDSLYIDIGASTKEEAEKYVSLGDSVTFDSDWSEFGENNEFIKAKALDDRLGCAIMLEMLLEEQEYDLTFTFTVQEEVGCRGAIVATNRVNPDYAIALECTTASDINGVSGEKRVCSLGGGAVVSFMDGGTVYQKDLYRKAMDIAEDSNINAQTKTMIAGGNNASQIHKSACGVKTLAVSVPCRYLHSPSCVVKKSDVSDVKNLVVKLISEFAYD